MLDLNIENIKSVRFADLRLDAIVLGIFIGLIPLATYPSLIVIMCVVLYRAARNWFVFETCDFFPVLQFAFVSFIVLVFHEGLDFFSDLQRVYIFYIFMTIPLGMALRSFRVEQDHLVFFALLGSFLCVLFSGSEYFFTDGCRVSGLVFNPLLPPFLSVPLFLFCIGHRMEREKFSLFDSVLIAFFVIMVANFFGGRSAFYTLMGGLIFVAALSAGEKKFSLTIKILTPLVLGCMIIAVIDYAVGCDFSSRVMSQVSTIVHLLEGVLYFEPTLTSGLADVDSSMSTRWQMWSNGMSAFLNLNVDTILGVGPANEKFIAGSPFLHVHNQFLSWLLGGGLVSFLSAIFMLFAPVYRARWTISIVLFMFSIFMGLLVDSLMRAPEGVGGFLIIYLFFFSIISSKREGQ